MARIAGTEGKATAAKARAAALSLFARHGYAAVSMRQIAAEVGVGAGALYNHFETKQDLLVKLMEGHLVELLNAMADACPEGQSTSPTEALEGFTRHHIQFHVGRADAVFVAYMELRSLEPENFRKIEELRRQYETILTKILTTGAATGAFRIVDPRISAMAIIGMLSGFTHWYRDGGRLSATEIEDIYVDMALSAVAA